MDKFNEWWSTLPEKDKWTWGLDTFNETAWKEAPVAPENYVDPKQLYDPDFMNDPTQPNHNTKPNKNIAEFRLRDLLGWIGLGKKNVKTEE